MKRFNRAFRDFFFDRLSEREIDLIIEYFYDKENNRFNEISNEYVIEKRFRSLLDKGIVKKYVHKKYLPNHPKYLFLLDRELKSKLNKEMQ